MTYSAEIIHAGTGKALRMRSAATTGKRLFTLGGKASSAWGRRWADLTDLHAADLGGPEVLSEAEMSLIRRASAMECQLEQLEARFSEENPAEWDLTDLHARISGALRRLFETLGLKRVGPRYRRQFQFPPALFRQAAWLLRPPGAPGNQRRH